MSSALSSGGCARAPRTPDVARGLLVLVALVLATTLLTACGGPPDVTLDGDWRLVRAVDHGRVTEIGHRNETTPSLGFGRGGDRAGATDGCTWYGYRTEVDGHRVSFREIREDRSYGPCYAFDPSHGALPTLLPRITRAERHEDSLVLTGRGVRLELTRPPVDPPVPPRALSIDGGWQLSAGTVHGRPVPILGPTPITLEVLYDGAQPGERGRLRGGCASAAVHLATGWFHLGRVIAHRSCPGTQVQVERQVVRGLADVRHFEMIKTGDAWTGMTLRGRRVSLTFEKVRYFDISRIFGRWRVVETRTGGVTAPATDRRRVPRGLGRLAIRDVKELTFTLAAGCRRLEGTWRFVNSVVWLPVEVARVTRTCPPSATRSAEEITRAFSTSTRFRLRRDVLSLQDYDGAGLLLRKIS